MSFSDQRDDLVPFFKSNKSQIIFEFFYILTFLLVCVAIIISIHLSYLVLDERSKHLAYAALGGLLGGWTFVAKWFYMVTAKGRDNEKRWSWEYHKFYWRMLTPFVAGLLSFSIFLLGDAGIIQVKIGSNNSAAVAYAFCYVMGYFSDIVMSKLSKLAHSVGGQGAQQ